MIKDPQHDTKGSLTELLYDLIAVSEMLVVANSVFLLVGVEARIGSFVDFSVCESSGQIRVVFVFLSLANIEEVDDVVLEDLLLLVLPQQVLQDDLGLRDRHRELDLIAPTRVAVLVGLHLRAGLCFL